MHAVWIERPGPHRCKIFCSQGKWGRGRWAEMFRTGVLRHRPCLRRWAAVAYDHLSVETRRSANPDVAGDPGHSPDAKCGFLATTRAQTSTAKGIVRLWCDGDRGELDG